MILFTPGPVMVRDEVLAESSRQVISHRGPSFRKLLASVEELINIVAGNSGGLAAVMPGSGTTAVDSMLWSLVEPGSRVLALSWGDFGDRMVESLRRRGARVTRVEAAWGEAVPPGDVEDLIKGHDYVAVVHNETSTGVAYRWLRRLAEAASSAGARLLVDSVSGLGGEEVRMDWGIYAMATCSHKALAAPPGVGVVLLSGEAVKRLRDEPPSMVPPFMDLSSYVRFLVERGETPYTPPVNALYSLKRALEYIVDMGVDRYIEMHRVKAEVLYNTGLEPFPRDAGYRSNTVVALRVGNAPRVKRVLEEYGYVVALGMKATRNSVVRIGTMGATTLEQVSRLAVLLRELGQGS